MGTQPESGQLDYATLLDRGVHWLRTTYADSNSYDPLDDRLDSFSQSPSEPIYDYLDRLLALQTDCASVDYSLSASQLSRVFKQGLRPDLSAVASTSLLDPSLTVHQLASRLDAHQSSQPRRQAGSQSKRSGGASSNSKPPDQPLASASTPGTASRVLFKDQDPSKFAACKAQKRCIFYIFTGKCRLGSKCRYAHQPLEQVAVPITPSPGVAAASSTITHQPTTGQANLAANTHEPSRVPSALPAIALSPGSPHSTRPLLIVDTRCTHSLVTDTLAYQLLHAAPPACTLQHSAVFSTAGCADNLQATTQLSCNLTLHAPDESTSSTIAWNPFVVPLIAQGIHGLFGLDTLRLTSEGLFLTTVTGLQPVYPYLVDAPSQPPFSGSVSLPVADHLGDSPPPQHSSGSHLDPLPTSAASSAPMATSSHQSLLSQFVAEVSAEVLEEARKLPPSYAKTHRYYTNAPVDVQQNCDELVAAFVTEGKLAHVPDDASGDYPWARPAEPTTSASESDSDSLIQVLHLLNAVEENPVTVFTHDVSAYGDDSALTSTEVISYMGDITLLFPACLVDLIPQLIDLLTEHAARYTLYLKAVKIVIVHEVPRIKTLGFTVLTNGQSITINSDAWEELCTWSWGDAPSFRKLHSYLDRIPTNYEDLLSDHITPLNHSLQSLASRFREDLCQAQSLPRHSKKSWDLPLPSALLALVTQFHAYLTSVSLPSIPRLRPHENLELYCDASSYMIAFVLAARDDPSQVFLRRQILLRDLRNETIHISAKELLSVLHASALIRSISLYTLRNFNLRIRTDNRTTEKILNTRHVSNSPQQPYYLAILNQLTLLGVPDRYRAVFVPTESNIADSLTRHPLLEEHIKLHWNLAEADIVDPFGVSQVHDEHTCPDPSPQDLGLMAKRLAPDDFPRADSVGSRVKQRRTQGLSLKHNAVNNLLIKILLRHFRLVWYLPHPALPVLYVPHKFKVLRTHSMMNDPLSHGSRPHLATLRSLFCC
ncbi:hypothetical protein FOZ60_001270 [Perkinsus olseni]|uniref:C3H1-type domain-containing protein n=1 Tax=Perkinsus olseni TaxID=32597 RepID=A0A7J6P2Z3_PEROL|nr:hypothetical protein FOZ60_001270 [Perkinsus olseni]